MGAQYCTMTRVRHAEYLPNTDSAVLPQYDVQNTWPRFFLLKRTNHSSPGIPLNQHRELGPQLIYGLQSPCRYKVSLQEEIEVPKGIRTFQLKGTKEGILTNLEWFHYLIHIATKQGTSCWQEAEQPGSVVSLADYTCSRRLNRVTFRGFLLPYFFFFLMKLALQKITQDSYKQRILHNVVKYSI